jgi:hypothetical protein
MPLGKEEATTATGTTKSGLGTMESVKKYFQDIFSGPRSAQLAAVAPAINATNEMADASRAKEAWFGTSRGGGTNEANQQADIQRTSTISNLIFGARPEAAKATAEIGKAQADVGLQQMTNALWALGLSESVIQHIIDSSIVSRRDSYAINKDTQKQWGQAIGRITTPFTG